MTASLVSTQHLQASLREGLKTELLPRYSETNVLTSSPA